MAKKNAIYSPLSLLRGNEAISYGFQELQLDEELTSGDFTSKHCGEWRNYNINNKTYS